MVRDPRREWEPVGLVDDDRTKRHLRIRGVSVVGDTSGIPADGLIIIPGMIITKDNVDAFSADLKAKLGS